MLEKVVITGVTADEDVAKIAIQKVPDRPGVAAKLFGALSREGINIRLIIQSIGEGKVTDVSIVVKKEHMKKSVEVLRRLGKQLGSQGVIYDPNMAEVSIVGSGIASSPGVAARMFRALAKKNINIDLISTSHVRIACVIDVRHVREAVGAIHKAFALDKLKRTRA